MTHGPYCDDCPVPARCGLGDMCLKRLPGLLKTESASAAERAASGAVRDALPAAGDLGGVGASERCPAAFLGEA